MSNAIGTALTAALGGLVAGRVYPLRMADKPVYPCLRYLIVGSNPDATLLGAASSTTWRYRIDVFADTAKECGQLIITIRSVMRGFSYKNFPVMEIEGFEPEIQVCRRTIDFTIVEPQDDETKDASPRAAAVSRR